MSTKESKLSKLREMDWRDSLWSSMLAVMILGFLMFALYGAQDIELAILGLAMFMAMFFTEPFRNERIIKRLNARISDLEDRLAKQDP